MDQQTLTQLMSMGSKVQRVLEFTGKFKGPTKGSARGSD
jgi:hypothetical protein